MAVWYAATLVLPLLTPDLFGQLNDHRQLCPLFTFGEDIAFFRGCETALRRQAELLQGYKFRRFVDPATEFVASFEPARFRSDKPQHDGFTLGHETQRLGPTRAIAVRFHEVAEPIDRVEQRFLDRLLAPRRNERRLH